MLSPSPRPFNTRRRSVLSGSPFPDKRGPERHTVVWRIGEVLRPAAGHRKIVLPKLRLSERARVDGHEVLRPQWLQRGCERLKNNSKSFLEVSPDGALERIRQGPRESLRAAPCSLRQDNLMT